VTATPAMGSAASVSKEDANKYAEHLEKDLNSVSEKIEKGIRKLDVEIPGLLDKSRNLVEQVVKDAMYDALVVLAQGLADDLGPGLLKAATTTITFCILGQKEAMQLDMSKIVDSVKKTEKYNQLKEMMAKVSGNMSKEANAIITEVHSDSEKAATDLGIGSETSKDMHKLYLYVSHSLKAIVKSILKAAYKAAQAGMTVASKVSVTEGLHITIEGTTIFEFEVEVSIGIPTWDAAMAEMEASMAKMAMAEMATDAKDKKEPTEKS